MNMRRTLHETMEQNGIKIMLHSISQEVAKCGSDRLEINLNTG